MSTELADHGSQDAAEDSAPAGAVEFTERELALIEGRDPDAPVEDSVEESVEEAAAEGLAAASFDEPPPVDEPASWVTDYDRQVASAFGISDDELHELSSQAELGRYVKFLNKHRQEAGPAEPAKQEEAEPEYVDEPIVNGKVNVAYYEKHRDEVGDADLIITLAKSQQELESKLSENAKAQEEQRRQREEDEARRETERHVNAFHDALDSHNPDLFGKSVDQFGNVSKLTPEQEKRRREVFTEISWLSRRIAEEQQQQGLPVALPAWSVLIKQAEQRLYAAELAKLSDQKKLSVARAQSRTIRPAAGSAGATQARRIGKAELSDPADIANDPDIIEAWNRLSEQR